jgi:hypothetical protein
VTRLPDPGTLRAAWWTVHALRRTRRHLRRRGLAGLALARPPALPDSAGRGVGAVLRRRPHTCLERALVLQRWHAAHGRPHDVVIGVRAGQAFGAHAWLEGVEQSHADAFRELVRVRP